MVGGLFSWAWVFLSLSPGSDVACQRAPVVKTHDSSRSEPIVLLSDAAILRLPIVNDYKVTARQGVGS